MKPIRKIVALCVIVASIIAFWLMPGINTAKETTYVRRYEDTNGKGDSLENQSHKSRTAKPVRQKVLYKTEKIHSKTKFSKIKPSMYSRAAQFEELVYLTQDSIRSRDSLRSFTLRNLDTAKIVH